MSAVCIIPARGGSQRIPRKNIRLFHGKPIITYSIEAAENSKLFDHVIVSTDDAEIAGVATDAGADVLIRPAALGRDDVGTQLVMQHAMRLNDAEMACCVYATCPLLSAADLLRGWQALHRPGAVYAYAVAEEPFGAAGSFYWGHGWAFRENVHLVREHSVMVPIPPERCIDINTEDDWQRAERMYAALREEELHV